MSASPPRAGGAERFVEEQRAVEEREARHQVRDERQLPRPVEPEHAEEDQLSERRPQKRQREEDAVASTDWSVVRELQQRERKQDDAAREHRAGREHGPGDGP